MRRSWLRLFWAAVVIAGAICGYLIWSDRGERLLHQEIETQLGRLLSGQVEIATVELHFDDGLRVEAHGFEAYPGINSDGRPVLHARRVLAWVDLLALLVGRLELSTLILEGPQIRIERASDGSFPGLPLLQRSHPSALKQNESTTEQWLHRLESLDPTASAFVEEFRAADQIQIVDGTASLIDFGNLDADGTPLEHRLELVSGTARRDWLTNEVALDVQGVYVDGQNTPFPIQFGVTRDTEAYFSWALTFSQIPLEATRTPLAMTRSIEGLSGTLDARFLLTTSAAGARRIAFEGVIGNASIAMRRSNSIITQEHVALNATIDLEPDRVIVSSGKISGGRLAIDFKGAIQRPIQPSSSVHLESRMVGVKIDGVRGLARRFESEFDLAVAISRLTERVEAGQIRYIQTAGTARLDHWQDLVSGRSQRLPDAFVLGAAVEKVVIGSNSADSLEDLAGEIEWAEDQISLRKMTGLYRGKPLPELHAVLNGVSNLTRTDVSARTMTMSPPPIPGVMPLLKIFEPRNPDSLPPVKAIGLAIDFLEHPIFRWPIRDLRVRIEPLRRGMQVDIREGNWGGAAIVGNLIWLNDPIAPSVSAQIEFAPARPDPNLSDPTRPDLLYPDVNESNLTKSDSNQRTPSAASDVAERPANPDRWGSGRFELDFRPKPQLPFQTATGFFRLNGSDLVGNEVKIQLAPGGQAALRTTIGLNDPESVDLDVSFAITEGKLEDLSEFVVLPPDLANGDIGATGTLSGRVRPDTSFVAELDGRVRVDATNGKIKTTLPLLLRLGKATEGYNPFANTGELRYESMRGSIALDHGLLTIEDFEIEGPIRVYANARLNTNSEPPNIKAVVGIFLFRTPNQLFANLPLVRFFLPGSERGLIGAYFEVKGPVDEPDVEPLALQTLLSSVPDAIKAPFKVMRFLFNRGSGDK